MYNHVLSSRCVPVQHVDIDTVKKRKNRKIAPWEDPDLFSWDSWRCDWCNHTSVVLTLRLKGNKICRKCLYSMQRYENANGKVAVIVSR